MRKSTHSPEYAQVLRMLVRLRKEAGLTQRQLAHRLEREYSFVWRIEKGERRVDLVEFLWICRVLGADAARCYRRLITDIEREGKA